MQALHGIAHQSQSVVADVAEIHVGADKHGREPKPRAQTKRVS